MHVAISANAFLAHIQSENVQNVNKKKKAFAQNLQLTMGQSHYD